ncbi:MAG: macro domain-containing protein [Clostridia bacterium]|nr:macro domain-containing protein [Clostridia bacterium]
MIEYFEGTVFNTNADAIVNTVNTVGVMGAGLALEFALRYPKMCSYYEQKCKSYQIKTGKVEYFMGENKTIILFPTKQHFKYPSQIEWIEQGLINFVETHKQHSFKSVAFPKLGTLNGGLQWNQVQQLMEKYLAPLDITIFICLDSLKKAEGKEAEMLEILNNMTVDDISRIVRLNSTQQNVLAQALPLDRFWKLLSLPKIGITTYTKLFNHCYYNQKTAEQLSFFN